MKRSTSRLWIGSAVVVCGALAASGRTQAGAPLGAPVPKAPIDITVSEGTSMSVAVSPDGQTLAIDLQGSIWTLPAKGGPAKRITDLFNDASTPATPRARGEWWSTFSRPAPGSWRERIRRTP